MEEFLGIIKAFAGNFAPRGWLFCNGQLVGIAQNNALFAILGTTYGGNGQTTFGIPDLRGRSPIGWGQGPGLSNYNMGQVSGIEQTTILLSNLPPHNHPAVSTLTLAASNGAATNSTPVAGNALAAASDVNGDPAKIYNAVAPNVALNGGSVVTTVGLVGNGLPISILQPTLAMSYIICVEGVYPSRN